MPSWRGADLARLLDESHASIQGRWKERLERWGWQVWVERSFNVYGERGRIDLLAWHPVRRCLLVGEVKTEIADAQDLLGRMDVKVRLAPVVCRSLGIRQPAMVVPLLLVAEGNTNRDRIRRLAPLLTGFDLRGRQAISWLRLAGSSRPLRGLLIVTESRDATGSSVPRPARHRVRSRKGERSVNGPSDGAPDASRLA